MTKMLSSSDVRLKYINIFPM